MPRFANPELLSLLFLSPLALVLSFYFYKTTKRKLAKYFYPATLEKLTSSISYRKRKIKILMEAMVLAFVVLGLARLQIGQGEQEVKNEGIELIIAIDVSNSMLTEDLKPSRLAYARREVQKLLDQMQGHRVGLIVFAGSAVLVSPLTPDYSALRLYLQTLSPESVSTQGTNFKKVMEIAKSAFEGGGIKTDNTTKVTRGLLLVSDGEDNEKGAAEMAKEMQNAGIHIFSLGIGTEEGGSIPLRDNYGYLKGYKKDKDGKIIVSRLQTNLLKAISEAAKGSFYVASFSGSHISSLSSDLDQLQKTGFDSKVATQYNEYFQIFIWMALILAFLELLLSERKSASKLWQGRFQEERGE